MRFGGIVGTCLLVAVFPICCDAQATTAGLQSYARAKQVLDDGVLAVGGLETLQNVKSVRRQMSGEWIGSGQHPRPYTVAAPTLTSPPANGLDDVQSVIDYAGNRWFEEALESDIKRQDSITRRNAGTNRAGFEAITFRNEKPYFRAYSTDDAQANLVRRFRRYPEGALRMALERPESLQWVGPGREFDREQDVISFTDVQGNRVLLYFDARTHLLTKTEILREHALAGDSSAEVIYDDYRAVGRLRLPFRYIDRVAGVPTVVMQASSIELDAPVSDEAFRAPDGQSVVLMAADPPQPKVEKLGEGLYMIRGPYNIVFAEFRDQIVVFEAPLNSRYSETCLALIRATVPDKPVRYLVSTHFHYDHVAGVRPYIAGGVSILTTPDAQPIIEQVAASRRTMYPDALSRNPQSPKIEILTAPKVLDDGSNRVELYDLGPTDHITQMLIAYFPREKLLFQADVWDPISLELVIAGPDAVKLAGRIKELRLPVERIISVHGVPATMEALERGLAVRAKYFP